MTRMLQSQVTMSSWWLWRQCVWGTEDAAGPWTVPLESTACMAGLLLSKAWLWSPAFQLSRLAAPIQKVFISSSQTVGTVL